MLVTILIILLIVVVLGALFGGDSLGETIRIGCGVIAVIIIIAIAVFFTAC